MYVVSNDFIPVHKIDTTNNTLYRAVCCMYMYSVHWPFDHSLDFMHLTIIQYIVLLAHKSEFN